MRRPALRWIACLAAACLAGTAAAQPWKPADPVEIIVGAGPGGGNDNTARTLQKLFQEARLVQVPINVVNRAGAGGAIALTYLNQQVGKANYLGLTSNTLLTNHITRRSPLSHHHFTPLAVLINEYMVFSVKPDSTLASGKDLVARLKKDPGSVVVGISSSLGNINHIAFATAARAIGATPVPLGIVRDTAADLRRALREAAAKADLIVTSGGVSVGDHDHVKPVVDELGSMDFWSIAIRPGRPLAFGEIDGKLIFGLPGNPVSALLGFELFVRPALLKMAGRSLLHRPRVTATLDDTLDTPPGLRTFARGIHDPRSGTVRTTGPQGSGILRSMALANSFIDVPATVQHLDRGATVTVIRTDQPEDH